MKRQLLIVLILTLLAVPALALAPPPVQRAVPAEGSVWIELRGAFEALLAALGRPRSTPKGAPTGSPSTGAHCDGTAGMDPNGCPR